jgi:glycosyltransferase involved in cell wall biosynthesis
VGMESVIFRSSFIPQLVSVVVPVYTGITYLPEAIRSVCEQSYREVELILVDDCSGENLSSYLQKVPFPSRVECLHQRSGVAAARNYGVSFVQGEFVAFLDADDLWDTGHLFRRIEMLRGEPQALGSRGYTSSFYSNENGTHTSIATNFTPFHVGASVFRRGVFDKVGLFDESMMLGSDADFFFRCRYLGIRFADGSDVSLYYRKSDSTLSHTPEEPRKILRGLAHALQARGAREGSI